VTCGLGAEVSGGAEAPYLVGLNIKVERGLSIYAVYTKSLAGVKNMLRGRFRGPNIGIPSGVKTYRVPLTSISTLLILRIY